MATLLRFYYESAPFYLIIIGSIRFEDTLVVLWHELPVNQISKLNYLNMNI